MPTVIYRKLFLQVQLYWSTYKIRPCIHLSMNEQLNKCKIQSRMTFIHIFVVIHICKSRFRREKSKICPFYNTTFSSYGFNVTLIKSGSILLGRSLLIKSTGAPLQCSKSSPKMQNTVHAVRRRNVALQLTPLH